MSPLTTTAVLSATGGDNSEVLHFQITEGNADIGK